MASLSTTSEVHFDEQDSLEKNESTTTAHPNPYQDESPPPPNDTVILLYGSSSTHIGFGGSNKAHPRSTFPSATAENGLYFGDEALTHANIVAPIERGIIIDWDRMEGLWHHAFYNEARIDTTSHHLMLVQPPITSKSVTNRIIQTMFSKFSFISVSVVDEALAAMLYIQRGKSFDELTGLLVSSGAQCTYVVPIVAGYVLHHALVNTGLAGFDITTKIGNLMDNKKEGFKWAGLRITNNKIFCDCEDIKKNVCYVSEMSESCQESDETTVSYIMNEFESDELELELPMSVVHSPDLLFHPNNDDVTSCMPLQNGVYKSVCMATTDDSLRADLYSNIALEGGNTMFKNFGSRLKSEVEALLAVETPEVVFTVNVVADVGRRSAKWLGCNELLNTGNVKGIESFKDVNKM